MSEQDFINVKKELEAVLYFARENHDEAIRKARLAVENAIFAIYGLKVGTIVSLDNNPKFTYAIQSFYITTPNILRNDIKNVIDRVQVVLRETNELGELDMEKAKHTIGCFIADIKLNSKINQ